jgi:hypothetical protein
VLARPSSPDPHNLALEITAMSTLASLTAADAALTAEIHATADQLDAVATTGLDAALARLAASVTAAEQRLAAARARLAAVLDGGGPTPEVPESKAATTPTASYHNLVTETPAAQLPTFGNCSADDDTIDLSQSEPDRRTLARKITDAIDGRHQHAHVAATNPPTPSQSPEVAGTDLPIAGALPLSTATGDTSQASASTTTRKGRDRRRKAGG